MATRRKPSLKDKRQKTIELLLGKYFLVSQEDMVSLKEAYNGGPLLDIGLFSIGLSITITTILLTFKTIMLTMVILISLNCFSLTTGIVLILVWIKKRNRAINRQNKIQRQKFDLF